MIASSLCAREDDYPERAECKSTRNTHDHREIIKIKLRSSVVMEGKQQAVRFAAKHEIRCHVALHSSTELALSITAQDSQKMPVVTKIIFEFNSG